MSVKVEKGAVKRRISIHKTKVTSDTARHTASYRIYTIGREGRKERCISAGSDKYRQYRGGGGRNRARQ